jgi:hypothetical protein
MSGRKCFFGGVAVGAVAVRRSGVVQRGSLFLSSPHEMEALSHRV